jgi:hypothetical protein
MRAPRALTIVALAWLAAGCPRETGIDLGAPQSVADGVQLYQLHNPNLLDPPGPVAVQLLRLDPSKVDLRAALANDHVVQLEPVPGMAQREHAIAAINGGFFVLKSGDPTGLLELRDELVSDTPMTRGAVGIIRAPGKPISLIFDRVSARAALRYAIGGETITQDIDGVDTTRARGKLMLYTPRFGPDSGMADTGVEWQLAGSPLRVVERRPNEGHTPIPRDGVVLSFGGTVLPAGLERLDQGQEVTIETRFHPLFDSKSEQWILAQDISGGAGLLIYRGLPLTDWSSEQLPARFDTDRHPRTMIGASRNGTIWLVTVDGRNPALSLGMNFGELQKLAQQLNLYYALNLDGGGSTTMVAGGKIVNHPSDPQGARAVSDALLVVPRR